MSGEERVAYGLKIGFDDRFKGIEIGMEVFYIV